MNWLLIFIPIAFGLDHWHAAAPFVIFIVSALAIIPLAVLLEKATGALAHHNIVSGLRRAGFLGGGLSCRINCAG